MFRFLNLLGESPIRPVFLLGCLTATALLGGCGDSREDLFKKHAARSRSAPDEEEPQPQVAQQQPAAQTQPATSAGQTAKPVANANAQNPAAASQSAQVNVTPVSRSKSATPEELSEKLGIKPISQRQPEEELSVEQRRRRSYENLVKINDALQAYLDQNGKYPRSHRKSAGGIPTLSWRVDLLPYLGYQELYDQFDLTRGWDMSPNKQLLEFIPDEYVSPERFDVKTNYLMPTETTFVFGDNRSLAPQYIDDGPENTLMMLEVNDRYSVSWSEPVDFKPTYGEDLSPYVGKLRTDGTFALWANGYPTLLETGLSNAKLYAALTYRKGEGLKASDIHRKIAFAQADEDPALDESLPEQMVGDETNVPRPAVEDVVSLSMPQIEEIVFEREPLPSAPSISKAQDKLRVIYREKLEDADSSTDKGNLASELLAAADEIDADAPGAYVLQQAALKLAVESGDAGVLIQAIDKRVAKFDINSFEENLKWIQAFGEATASRDSSSVKGAEILNRSVPVIYAGIREDQYMLASSVARIAARFSGKKRDDRVARLLTRLRTQLGAAKREYDKSVESLTQYRNNPDDVVAGASFGTFLCFIKGDWKKGLPLIAEGARGDLSEIAAMDLRGARRAIDQVAIADAWWELSLRGSGVYRQGAQDRAVLWYQAALDRLPQSLDRIHVKNRLKEADEIDGRSPIALCLQLSEELGVDLSASLTSIAVAGGRVGRPGFEEDD